MRVWEYGVLVYESMGVLRHECMRVWVYGLYGYRSMGA